MTMNIPGYQLVRLLGRGGMAEVYLANQISLNREVAIKIIKDPKDPAFRERFQSEARTNASLNHPNIVTIHDFGSLDENNYIVMELLRGGELRQRLTTGMSLRQIVEAMRDVSAALAYAHSQGIVHRDVTSANVMFGADGRAVLTDFGIAKLFGANSTKMTGTGLIIGTPDYMSPEQIRGEPLDGRADIYSLGIVFWEALTGTTPFHSDSTITTCMRHLNEALPPLPRLVGPVGDVVFRMLAKQPAERYQTADELVTDLDTAFAHLPAGSDDAQATVQLHRAQLSGQSQGPQSAPWVFPPPAAVTGKTSPPVSGMQPAQAPRWRRPLLAVAALALLVSIGAGGWWYHGRQQALQLTSLFDEVGALRQKVNTEEDHYYQWQQAQHKALLELEEKLKNATTPQEQQRLRSEVSLASADEAQLGTEELIAAELVFNHADEDRLTALGERADAILAGGKVEHAIGELTEIRDNYRNALRLLAALEKLRGERHQALAARLDWERERTVAQQPQVPGEASLIKTAERAHQLLEDSNLDEAAKAFREVGREYNKLLKSAQYAWRARDEAEQERNAWRGKGINPQAALAAEEHMREAEKALKEGHWSTATGAFVVAKEQFATLATQMSGAAPTQASGRG